MDGVPFRKLGDQQGLSGKQAFLKVRAEINQLPWNWQLTKILCNMLLFCGILVIDGKYIAVKGFEAKIPFIYGIDYLTHDIPHGDLFPVEDEAAFSQFFGKLKELGYEPKVVIADDRQGLKQALNKVFPYAKLQLCHVHFLENIRQLLNIRTDERYHHFFNSLVAHIFKVKNQNKTTKGLMHVFYKRTYGNRLLENIVTGIKYRQVELFNYLQIKNCPNNTNLIELYNSHLQARLKSIKGFQSFDSAKRWLNGYLIRRRTKPLTDCKTKFRKLNGFASLQFTIADPQSWPAEIAGIKLPKKEPKR
jgi:transposase-like protein